MSHTVDGLAVACERYGPGRLPGADRPAIGAGYAGAAAAIGSTLLFATLGIGSSLVGFQTGFDGVVLATIAVATLPLVAPVAFVSGAIVVRLLPRETPHFGGVAGLVGTCCTYLGCVLVVAAVLTGWAMYAAPGEFADAPQLAALVGVVAVVYTGWLTLPIGIVSGWLYERAALER